MIKYWISNSYKRASYWDNVTSGRDLHNDTSMDMQIVKCFMNASMHMLMVQCNGWLHFYPQIPRKEVRAATTLLYLNVRCCTGTYHTNPVTVSSYACSIWECKSMIAMHELHIPPKFITPRAIAQVDKYINPQIM